MSFRIDQLAVLNLATVGNSITAGSFVRSGGTSSQFLKADGTVDTNAYITGITSGMVTTALGYTPVPNTRNITINGVTQDLSIDRTWTISVPVTSVSGSGAGISVSPTTGAVIVSNTGVTSNVAGGGISVSSATGAVTITNTGVTSIVAGTAISISGATGAVTINNTGVTSLNGSTGALTGFATQAWVTSQGYLTANQTITLSGEASGSGTTSISVTLGNSAVINKVLTGLTITGSTIASTDSILTAFGKLQNQVNGLIGGVIYQGTWNASTNSPALTSSVGTKGYYYVVSTAGSTNLNGITDWKIGDWVIYNGSAWEKVDNTDAVSSVNGQTGAVVLSTTNIAEGTNLYYTDARARQALSFVAGSGAYNSSTGVITIPTNTNQLTNGAGFITGNQTITLSGDATGSGTTSISVTLASTGVAAGTYGGNNSIPSLVIDAKGRVTSASTVTPSGTWGISITGTAGSETLATVTGRGATTSTALTFNGGITIAGQGTGTGIIGNAGFTSNYTGISLNGTLSTSNYNILSSPTEQTLYINRPTGVAIRFREANGADQMVIATGGAVTFSSTITASSLIRSGGTSSQFLKADGSVDSNSYITSASVGNGTLTLAVSGSGLSGSASFTANQSGNTTFTVTSNATTAATANTLVYRDASGHITGNYGFFAYVNTSDNDETGITRFVIKNGDNYHRSATTTTAADIIRGVASGTWSINITGSAGSATNSTNTENVASGNISNLNTAWTLPGSSIGNGFRVYRYNAGATGEPVTYDNANWLINIYSHPSGGTASYGHQIAAPDTENIYFRLVTNGTFYSWRALLHSGNYNSYAPTLTGTGASGTWGISISGNAATATNADTVDGFHASQSTVANNVVVRDANGYIFGNYINMTDDGNPGGGTSISSFITKQGDNYYRSVSPTNAMVSIRGVASGSWGINITGSAGSASTASQVTHNASRTDGTWYNIGWFAGNPSPAYSCDSVQILSSAGAIRANIYYDNDNTAYYLNPASGSTSLRIAGGIAQNDIVGRPAAYWGSTGTTGAVVIKFPGNTGNYGMIHAVIDIYEYNGNDACTVIVGGHNWGSAWYNYGAQVVGSTDKPVRVGVKDGQYCIVIGNGSSSWSYGQVVLRKIQNGTYYSGVMDIAGGYTVAIESDTYSWISGDLRNLETPLNFYAGSNIYMGGNLVATQSWVNSQGFATGGPFLPLSGGTISGNLNVWSGILSLHRINFTDTSGSQASDPYSVRWISESSARGAGLSWLEFQLNDDSNEEIRIYGNSCAGYGCGAISDNLYHRFRADGYAWHASTGEAGSDFRAPIFYDSADTTYYIDPASTSDSALRMRGGALFGPNTSWGKYLYVGTNGRVGSSATVAVTNGNLHIDCENGYALYLNWYSTNDIYTQANLGVGAASAAYRLHVHGTGYATSDFRAPIFYDSDNTGYYGNFASFSYFNQLGIADWQYIGGQTSNGQSNYQWEGATYRNPGDWTARLIVRRDNASTGINGSMPSLVLFNNNGSDQTTVSMVFATNECASGSNSVNLAGIIAKKEAAGACGGWSPGSLTFFVKDYGTRRDALTISTAGNVDTPYTMYAAAYRGNANVGGTGDATWHPAGIYSGGTEWFYGTMYRNGSATYHANGNLFEVGQLQLNNGFTISQGGSNYGVFNSWVRLDGHYGFYAPSHNNAHIYPNNGTYGSWRIAGSRNGWNGIEFDASNGQVVLMVNPSSNTTGFHNNSYGWQFFWENGSLYVYKNSYGGGTQATVIDSTTIGSQSVNYANYAQYLSSSNYIIQRGTNGNWNADFQATPAGTLSYGGDLSANGSLGPGGSWWMQQNFRHTNSSNFWGVQVAWGWEDNANRLATRNVTGGSYGGWVYYLNSSNFTSYAAPNGGILTNTFYFQSNLGGYCGSLSGPPLQAYSTSNNSAFFSFHKSGVYAVNMGLDADSVLRIGGWSASANRWQLDMSGNMTVAGDVTAYSDARVKENIETVEDALDKVLNLRGVYYNRTDSEDKRRKVGVIAQEILEVIPEVVAQDNAGMYNVSYGNIVGVLIEAIKEQQKQIDELKARLD